MALVSLVLAAAALAGEPPGLRRQDFNADPGWESHRSRLLTRPSRITRQDFGHRPTNHAGGEKPGEVGGWVQRSVTPAWYAKAIPPRTLSDRLSASGRFAVPRDEGGSGILIGWFHEDSRGWRTPNSLAFRIDGNGGKYWVLYEYGTRGWLTGGGATFEGRYQTTKTRPFLTGADSHRWSLDYDPRGNQGQGELTFTLDGKTYSAPMLPGHQADGALFNRFGIFNQQISGDGMEVYLDDLVLDGRAEDFSSDPGWESRGSRTEFEEHAIRPLHDFGWSRSGKAGGKEGEAGGIIWRDEEPAYYADRVERLSLKDELFASGKLAFTGAGSDSAVWIGWFDSSSKKGSPSEQRSPQKSLLGILIEGQSRIGHYFRQGYHTAAGEGIVAEEGPLIRPDGKVHQWSIHYLPAGAGGRGQISIDLDGQVRTIDLAPGHREAGAAFDRFGLFNVQTGGHFVYVYLDDLRYTRGPAGGR